MNYDEFLGKLTEIKDMGYVASHRKGDTGIGKTLEDLLGISENNIAGPDFEIYELKSGRKVSSSMLTLLTKAPLPRGANKRLVEVFGYKQRARLSRDQKHLTNYVDVEISESEVSSREKELHVTVDSIKINSVGLKLEIKDGKISIANDKNVEAYYERNILRKAFEKKYKKLIYVLSSNKKENRRELFWFNEAYLLDGFGFETFSELVKEGVIKLDLRIGHYPDGRPHDHGTGFRLMPKYLPRCFEKIVKII